MSRGSEIIVSADPHGKFVEGFIGAGLTPKPGTIMQIDASIALRGGRHTWKLYTPGADGNMPIGPYIVLNFDYLQGKTPADAYAAGDRAFGYIPEAGDELNLILGDVAGTGDDHALGEKLMVDNATGLLIVTTGTPESEVAVLLEVVTDPTANTLAWCMWAGH